jgi:DNA-damage-inducible protein D
VKEIFTMLGEFMTTEISQYEKSETFEKSKFIAKRGGKVAGNARIGAEKELGRPVTTRQNYLSITEKKNKLPDVNIRAPAKSIIVF